MSQLLLFLLHKLKLKPLLPNFILPLLLICRCPLVELLSLALQHCQLLRLLIQEFGSCPVLAVKPHALLLKLVQLSYKILFVKLTVLFILLSYEFY